MTETPDLRLARHLDEADIAKLIHRYCRGVDRRDFELVRSCYHPDATDHHGDFVGDVDGFIDYIRATLPRFERTMHFVGNIAVDVDGDRARSEAYVVAMHRLRASDTKPLRDFHVGLRYVDDFERRHGEWRIAARVCVFEWSRIDAVDDRPFRFGDEHVMGRHDSDDPVFASSISAAFGAS